MTISLGMFYLFWRNFRSWVGLVASLTLRLPTHTSVLADAKNFFPGLLETKLWEGITKSYIFCFCLKKHKKYIFCIYLKIQISRMFPICITEQKKNLQWKWKWERKSPYNSCGLDGIRSGSFRKHWCCWDLCPSDLHSLSFLSHWTRVRFRIHDLQIGVVEVFKVLQIILLRHLRLERNQISFVHKKRKNHTLDLRLGLRRWLQQFFCKPRVDPSTPVGWLAVTCNSSSRASSVLFWSPWALHLHLHILIPVYT